MALTARRRPKRAARATLAVVEGNNPGNNLLGRRHYVHGSPPPRCGRRRQRRVTATRMLAVWMLYAVLCCNRAPTRLAAHADNPRTNTDGTEANPIQPGTSLCSIQKSSVIRPANRNCDENSNNYICSRLVTTSEVALA